MQGGRPSNGRYPERPFQVKVGTPGIDQRLHALQIVRQPLINIKNGVRPHVRAPLAWHFVSHELVSKTVFFM
jgi:hypothetical protein